MFPSRLLLASLLLLLLIGRPLVTGVGLIHAGETPNIILVMCDDLGYGDLQCFHRQSPIQTPHLNAMAEQGLKFKRFYSAGPVCSPTRGSCLTGRHPYRYGIYFANVGHLKTDEITIPELLKPLGYTSGHFGKWHLGTLTKTIADANRGGPKGAEHFSPPSQHGYDESFVTESKVPTFDPMIQPTQGNRNSWDALGPDDDHEPYGTRYWDHAGREVTQNLKGDDSRMIMDRAIPFIENAVAAKQPFFAAIWFHAPHLPVVADRQHAAPYWDRGQYERNYYGCVSAMDEQMGRLRNHIQKLGISNDTLIWFCSDNGPEGAAGKAPGSAGPLRGRKRSLYEGGVRVPAILVWPGTVAPGSTDIAAVTSDFLPTITDLLGIQFPDTRPLDGTSLMAVITGRSVQRSKPIGFQSAKQIAWHSGDYKLYSDNQGKSWELYNLAQDAGETTDLAAAQPDLVRQLAEQAASWRQSCERSDAGKDY